MFKIRFDEFLSHSFQTSAFVMLYGLLIFLPLIRPPVILTLILVSALVYFSMYFGADFAKGPIEKKPTTPA